LLFRVQFTMRAVAIGTALIFYSQGLYSQQRKDQPPIDAKLVQQVEEFSLQKKRKKASELLLLNIEPMAASSRRRRQLITKLHLLMKMFYTEKAQQMYESGESLYYSGAGGAATKFKEALKIEGDNVSVLLALARTDLQRGNCDESLTTLGHIKKLDPYLHEAKVLRFKVLVCKGQFEELNEAWSEKFLSTGEFTLYMAKWAHNKNWLKILKEASRQRGDPLKAKASAFPSFRLADCVLHDKMTSSTKKPLIFGSSSRSSAGPVRASLFNSSFAVMGINFSCSFLCSGCFNTNFRVIGASPPPGEGSTGIGLLK